MFKLRDYQENAVERVLEEWKTHSSTLVVLPTGCGKTVVFGALIKRLLSSTSTSRVLILAHRQELITQARDKVAAITGADVQIEMGDIKVTEMFGRAPAVVVSTVQTQNAGRMEKFNPDEFSAVIIDEAHHATSPSYREVIDYYRRNPNCKILGVTATPDRADETALGSVFESVAYEYTHADATRDGWLVPVHQEFVKVDTLDFSGVSVSAGDLNQAELAEVMEDERNLHAVAAPVLQLLGSNDRAIVFATSVRQAERLAEILNRSVEAAIVGGEVADWVSGATPKEDRRRKLDAFKAGKIRFMVNVGILTEGFDDAGVTCVVMARPTKSRALYAQMVGRATRPAADVAVKLGDAPTERRNLLIRRSSKPICRVIDFVGNSGRHKLVSAVDILGGKDLDEEVKDEAKKILAKKSESGENEDTLEAIEEAKARIKERREIDAKRRAFVQATAKFIQVSVDPFNVYDLPPVEEIDKGAPRHLSYKQEQILREQLKVDPDALGYAKAKQLLDEHFRRMSAHEASLPQERFLKKAIPVPMSRSEASRTITRLIHSPTPTHYSN